MSWLHRLFKRRADAELDEEIRFHLAQEIQLHIDRGESAKKPRAWHNAPSAIPRLLRRSPVRCGG